MRGPSLQTTTALSFAMHLAFFLVAALILRHSRNVIMPSPYEVSLIGPISSSQGAATREIPEQGSDRPAVRDEIRTRIEQMKQSKKMAKDSKADAKRLEDQIAALGAKKKMRDIVDLRGKVSSANGVHGRNVSKSAMRGTATGLSQGTLFDSYYGKITSQIRQEWVYPDTGEKNLEAVISVIIARDGTVSVKGIDKSSGNPLFDRLAMRALAKASPVAPPPYEMEIGLRFYP
jgi:colicin import membrane protein